MTPIQKTIINKTTSNVPIWLMRQAGRYLPEFREIRKINTDFIELCLDENLSSEITLQPLKRFELDAAIIFSDILMLPYGLNQKVEFCDGVPWERLGQGWLPSAAPRRCQVQHHGPVHARQNVYAERRVHPRNR